MNFLIDTNICSAYIKGKREVFSRFQQHSGQLGVAAITVAELTTWSIRSPLIEDTRKRLDQFLKDMPCLDFTYAVAIKCGELRATQLAAGVPMPLADLLIASTALVHNLTVVTNNVKDFARVDGLVVVDWLAN
jgi:tRNA(fMet)-specific endonuclease VapC